MAVIIGALGDVSYDLREWLDRVWVKCPCLRHTLRRALRLLVISEQTPLFFSPP